MTDTDTTEGVDKPGGEPGPGRDEGKATGQDEAAAKPAWWIRHYTFFGTAVGLVFIWLSLTPSLLPRGPLFQGLVSGGAGAIGYGIGVFAVWLVRY
ncbi:alpha/beta-hydrolase N-terminal domain-containing protein, partial [Mycolicibacterium goodii]